MAWKNHRYAVWRTAHAPSRKCKTSEPIKSQNQPKVAPMIRISRMVFVICLMFGASGCFQKAKYPQPQAKVEQKQDVIEPKVIEPEVKLLTQLDADQNGLYDDGERKVLLDEMQKICPELDGIFDADGDGKVTIEEQTAGRHPLSMIIPAARITSSLDKIPWAIDIFPEWITTAYLQEDVAEGAVAEHTVRGTRRNSPALQATVELQPKKVHARSGIEFAADSGQHFSMKGQRDARWNYRWCIFTFRIDGSSGTESITTLLDLNQGNSSSKSSPKIWYDKNSGLNIQYVGQNKGGRDKRVMTARNVIADGMTWNVVVCGIRYGQMYASVNGVALTTDEPQPDRFFGDWPHDTTSYLGDMSRKGNIAWAYDALVFGLTEPSEAMVRKMTGWAAHRLGVQANLPADHPYRKDRPVLDAEDFPYRYVHDNDKWMEWGPTLKDKTKTRINAGGPRLEPQGFERVFYDDFRSDRIKASTSGEGDLWLGPGFNIAVGGDAPLVTPGQKPVVYRHDSEKQQQILSLEKQGKKRWRGSAFYSVNDLVHGYSWEGPKVFRIRCMFPEYKNPKDVPGGLFPAFWSYGTEWMFWRTSNRIEVDWFEFDGQNGYWYNGLSTHLHYSHFRNNIFAKNPNSYKRFKLYSGELKEAKSKIPGGLFFWDGDFHTWEFVVDQDMTYVNVTIKDENGEDKWVEICRCQTAPTYLERLDLQLDYALKGKHGSPKEREDFIVDWVEVLQKTDALKKLPEPFTAHPVLTGTVTAESTISCNANLEGITDIRYYWFSDGYPITYTVSNSLTISPEAVGTNIRCMVKAVGAINMPEAWSNTLK